VAKPVLIHWYTGGATAVKENLSLAPALPLVEGRGLRPRAPRFVEVNDEMSESACTRGVTVGR
jgi:hypothetical protein